MRTARIITGALAIIVGCAAVVLAGFDDSPGGQVLGAALVFFGMYRAVTSGKKHPARPE